MELIKTANKEKAFRNLFNSYTYELSLTSDPALGKYINDEGAYVPPFGLDDYFNGKKEAYVIMENKRAIDFAAYVNDEDQHQYLIEEAFVISTFRRQGIFTSCFNQYLENKTGSLMTHILKGDTSSQKLFEKLFTQRYLTYRKEERDPIAWNYFIKLSKTGLSRDD